MLGIDGRLVTEPIELEALFSFMDGFVARVPAIMRTEYAVTP